VRDLKTVRIHLERAEDGVVVHLQDRVAELLHVQRPGPPDGLHENLTAAVTGSGVIGEIGAREFFPVRLEELPRPGILPCDRDQAAGPDLDQLGRPGGGAIDELRITPQDVLELGRVHAHCEPVHPGIHVRCLQLPDDGHRVVEARGGRQHVGVGRPDPGDEGGKIGVAEGVAVGEEHLKPLASGQLDGAPGRGPREELVDVETVVLVELDVVVEEVLVDIVVLVDWVVDVEELVVVELVEVDRLVELDVDCVVDVELDVVVDEVDVLIEIVIEVLCVVLVDELVVVELVLVELDVVVELVEILIEVEVD